MKENHNLTERNIIIKSVKYKKLPWVRKTVLITF